MAIRLLLPSLRRNRGRLLAFILQFTIGGAVAAASLSLVIDARLIQARSTGQLQSPLTQLSSATAPSTLRPPQEVATVKLVTGAWRRHVRGETELSEGGLANSESHYAVVNPDYVRLIRPRTAKGRWLHPDDWEASAPIPVVLNASASRRMFPEGDPIGQQIGQQGQMVVVGVLAAGEPLITKADSNLANMLSLGDSVIVLPDRAAEILAETDLMGAFDIPPKVTWLGPIPTEYQSTLSLLPLADAAKVAEELYRENVAPLHLATGIVLALAALGLAGVTLSSLEQRVREFGIRAALGATPQGIMAQIVGETLCCTVLGGLIGSLTGLWLATQVPGGPIEPIWLAMLLVWAGISLLGGLVVLYPARAMGRLAIDTAIRYGRW